MEIKTESSVDDLYFDRTIINFTVKLNSGEMARLDEIKKELEKENSQGKLIIYTIKSVYGKERLSAPGTLRFFQTPLHMLFSLFSGAAF